MDIQPNYKIVLRNVNSEKNLMVINNLNEAEADKVYKDLMYPIIKGGYVKVSFF